MVTRKVDKESGTWIRWLENWRVDAGFYEGCVKEWGRVWRWEIGEGVEQRSRHCGGAGAGADVGGAGVLVCVVSKEKTT